MFVSNRPDCSQDPDHVLARWRRLPRMRL
jgi:hypothetical protein